MASTGSAADCFRRRRGLSRRDFLFDRFFAADDFLDVFDFFAGAFCGLRDFVFLNALILRAI